MSAQRTIASLCPADLAYARRHASDSEINEALQWRTVSARLYGDLRRHMSHGEFMEFARGHGGIPAHMQAYEKMVEHGLASCQQIDEALSCFGLDAWKLLALLEEGEYAIGMVVEAVKDAEDNGIYLESEEEFLKHLKVFCDKTYPDRDHLYWNEGIDAQLYYRAVKLGLRRLYIQRWAVQMGPEFFNYYLSGRERGLDHRSAKAFAKARFAMKHPELY